jgi:hypothetical protein
MILTGENRTLGTEASQCQLVKYLTRAGPEPNSALTARSTAWPH